MSYICGNYLWKAKSLGADRRDIYSLTGDLCYNNDVIRTVLSHLGLNVTSASFERHRGASEAGQKDMRHRSHVKPERWVLCLSGMWVYVRVSSHLLWCGDRIVSFSQMALPCERLMCESMRCSYAGKSGLSSIDLVQVFCFSKNIFPLILSCYEDVPYFTIMIFQMD